MRTKKLALPVFVLFFIGIIPAAFAGEATEQVRRTVDGVISILNDKELKKPDKVEVRRQKVRKVVDENFDFEEMAKRSLGLHWKNRSPQEQTEFVKLYTDLLQNTYIRKIERYENEKVQYTDERVEGKYALVKTLVVTEHETSIPIDYRIMKKEGKWEVYDIVVEGVSLVNNYRTQFNQIIRSKSYEDLVKKIKDKTIEKEP